MIVAENYLGEEDPRGGNNVKVGHSQFLTKIAISTTKSLRKIKKEQCRENRFYHNLKALKFYEVCVYLKQALFDYPECY